MNIFNIIFPKIKHIHYDEKINFLKIKNQDEDLLKKNIIKELKFTKKHTFFAASARSLILAIIKSLDLRENEFLIFPKYSCSYLYIISDQFSDNIKFCDYNNDTTYAKSQLLELINTYNIKGVFFSPLFGNDEEYEVISSIREKKIKIIYDHCQAIKIKKIIEITDYDIYSFNFGKQITGTGGGVLNTNEIIETNHFKSQNYSYRKKRFLYFLIFSKYRRFFYVFIKLIERTKFLDKFFGQVFNRERSEISSYKIHLIDLYLIKNQVKKVFDDNNKLLKNYVTLNKIFYNNLNYVNHKKSLCTKYIIQTKNKYVKKRLCNELRLCGIEYETLFKPHRLNDNIFFEELYLFGIALPNNNGINYKKISNKLKKINSILDA